MRINLQCSVEKACQPGGENRMAGESIYANVLLLLTANRNYELYMRISWCPRLYENFKREEIAYDEGTSKFFVPSLYINT